MNVDSANGSKGFDDLVRLALNLHWSWSHAADYLWEYLDYEQWQRERNPWLLLQSLAPEKIQHALGDISFCEKLAACVAAERQYSTQESWYQQCHPTAALSCISYFCMEFMLTEALPIYSGGLGNVAGDHLKGASDLGIPIVGVGLLYRRGYFKQIINAAGEQEETYPAKDPKNLPVTPLFNERGELLRIQIPLENTQVWLRAWQVQVGNARLYLLDSNDPENTPRHQAITDELYDGNPQVRLMQEAVLGIGGWQLLKELNLKPEVCHLNEGHAAFVALERARQLMADIQVPFEVALTMAGTGNIFTTHTAVGAGFDRFSPAMIEEVLGLYRREQLKIPLQQLLALGRYSSADEKENFTMALLAIRTSAYVNGVSKLHRKVSQQLFGPLFPRWPIDEIPVGYVTNGVHMPTWDSVDADSLWTQVCEKSRWMGAVNFHEEKIRKLPDDILWEFRNEARRKFLHYIQLRFFSGQDSPPASALLNPEVLTLGFARRFATYKRPNLLLKNPERLIKLLINPARPVKLFVAGKAHPKDVEGHKLILQWNTFIHAYMLHNHVFFLNDYDMLLAEHLVQGVDVWINTPRRPWEACGTSGMKVLVNGGLNLSELDGWWTEAFSPELGWALGDGGEHAGDPHWDDVEAEMLYSLLENEVVPEFYHRNPAGIPTAWIARMRESMAQLTPRFSTNRSLQEYLEKYYLGTANQYLACIADNGNLGKARFEQARILDDEWRSVCFGNCLVEKNGRQLNFRVEVCPGTFDVNRLKAQLYARGIYDSNPVIHDMLPEQNPTAAKGVVAFTLNIQTDRAADDYTPRLIIADEDTLPGNTKHILWQR